MNNKKVAVITGASSGIGRALSYKLYQKYDKIFLLGRSLEELKIIAEELNDNGGQVETIEMDLNSEESIAKAADQILSQTEKIHLLINNAGISQRALAFDTSDKVEKKIMQVNYFGPILLTKLLLKSMRGASASQIVVVSSIAGKFGYALRSSYSAAKHALHGYFESLRFEEEKHNISVLFSIPGRVKTAVSKNALTAGGEAYRQMDRGQAEGISAEKCALAIGKQIEQNKKDKLIGGKEILMVYFKKFWPSLFFYLAKRELKKDG